MKFQRKKVATALGCALGLSGTALLAGNALAADIRVDVTGTSIPRVEGEGSLPVTIINRQDIERSGVQTALELIDRISATQSIGNFNPALGEGGTLVGFAGVSLRGLGTQRTLVLLDGKRVAPYALSNTTSPSASGVDLNAIPISAIERIEVLRDGASALYGSDAIAGVINFILRKDYRGAEAAATYLDSQHGGGGSQRYNVTAGWGNLSTQRWNAFVTVDYLKQLSLRASDRQISRTAYIPGLGVDRTSGNTIPANISQNPADFGPGGGTAFRGTFNPGNPACLPPYSFPTAGSPTQCRFDFAAVIDTLPPSEQTNAIGKATFQIAPNHQAFVEGSLYHAHFLQAISPTPVSGAFMNNQPLLFPNSPYYPAAFITSIGGATNQPVRISWRSLETGPRSDRATTDQYRGVAGLQGTLPYNWDYAASVRYTENKQTDDYVGGYLSETQFLPLLASGVINPFALQTPQGLAALRSTQILGRASDNTAKDYGGDARISKEIWQLPAGPLAFAAGGEWRKESLSLINADFLSSGDIIGGAGALPSLTDSSRKVYAFFGELNAPIIRNLEGNVQVRYDHYSDVGSTTNPKFSLRYQPVRNVLLRGSYGKGFRAPALADLFQPPLRTNTNNTYSDPIRCPVTNSVNDCNLQFNSLRGGNLNLKPEKSDQWNLGVVWEPTRQLSFGLDYFNIKIKDVITILDASTIFNNFEAYQANFVVRRPTDPLFPNLPGEISAVRESTINLGKQEVSGWDIDIRFRQPTSFGSFTATLNGTYLDHYKQTDLATGDLIEFVGTAAQPQGAVSRWRHYASIDWTYGPWGATLAQNFQNGYQELTPIGERRVSSYDVYDLQLRYEAYKNVKLTLGVRNLFDRAPPQSGGVGTFQVGYDASYGDPRGRMFYGTIKVAWQP